MNYVRSICDLHQRLDRAAVRKTRQWWEAYMKGVIPFRGVPIPVIRRVLGAWRADHAHQARPSSCQLDLAVRLFDGRYTEDKLAGILYLQDYLLETVSWRSIIRRLSGIFRKGLIYDWNTCDWLCVRVLGPLIASNGRECAHHIASWSKVRYLWKARASVVPFVKVARTTSFHPAAFKACGDLIIRDERFAKTGVGWLLRDISRTNAGDVRRFLRTHQEHFSLESLKNAVKYLPASEQRRWVRSFKERRA